MFCKGAPGDLPVMYTEYTHLQPAPLSRTYCLVQACCRTMSAGTELLLTLVQGTADAADPTQHLTPLPSAHCSAPDPPQAPQHPCPLPDSNIHWVIDP